MRQPILHRRTVLGGALLAAAPRGVHAEGPVRIGVLTDENGPYSDSAGAGSVTAARMAAQDFGPTVLGRPIEIMRGDTLNKPDAASALARQWYDSGVDAIIDLPVTPVAAAVQQVARDKGRTVMITASAVSEFTSKNCAPVSSHWADDTHALAAGGAQLLTSSGGKTWFFITVDFSFGAALQAEATRVIEANGGRVAGTAKFPLGATDFSSQIIQAQAAGADVIGLAAVGNDQVNLIKQAAEFRLIQGNTRLAAFLVYITDIHAIGLKLAQGLSFPAGFYWDQNDEARSFAGRFMAGRQAAPTKNHASIYAGVTHFLKSMAQAGGSDPLAVNRAMRSAPVAFFGRPATMRNDGRVLYDITLYRVKQPEESKAAWDYYTPIGTIPAASAFLPPNPTCTA